MTKFDIRLRRSKFTNSRIESYKNYQSLLDKHQEYDKKKTRGIILIAGLVLIIVAILLMVFHTNPAERDEHKYDDYKVPGTEQNLKDMNNSFE